MGYRFSIIFYIQTLPVRILFPTKPVYKLHKWYHTHKNKSEIYDQISRAMLSSTKIELKNSSSKIALGKTYC